MSDDSGGTALAERGLAGHDQAVATFEEDRRSVLRNVQHFLHEYPTAVPFIVLLVGVLIFSVIVGGRFFALFNLSLILQQVTIIGVLGIAQTLVILTAGIDLSVGAIMVLSSIVMGRLAVVAGFPPEISFALGLLTGLWDWGDERRAEVGLINHNNLVLVARDGRTLMAAGIFHLSRFNRSALTFHCVEYLGSRRLLRSSPPAAPAR